MAVCTGPKSRCKVQRMYLNLDLSRYRLKKKKIKKKYSCKKCSTVLFILVLVYNMYSCTLSIR